MFRLRNPGAMSLISGVILLVVFLAYLLCPSYTIKVRFQLDRLLLILLAICFVVFLVVMYTHVRFGSR